MEKKCCNCGKLYEEGKVLQMKVEKVFEGKEYTAPLNLLPLFAYRTILEFLLERKKLTTNGKEI